MSHNVTMNNPVELGQQDFAAIKAALEFYMAGHRIGQGHYNRVSQLRDQIESSHSMWLDMEEAT